MDTSNWIALTSMGVAVAALIQPWVVRRDGQLRRDDVLAWGDEAITALQTLFLLIDDGCLDEGAYRPVRYQLSILIERGRMFFRNARPLAHGRKKRQAYQGFRPCILDHLVAGYEIAKAFPISAEQDRRFLRHAADDRTKLFVSLLQKEVGRSRTASTDTREGGTGISLAGLLSDARRELRSSK